MDVTAIVSAIEALAVPIASVGGAVLVIHYGAKAFSWIRKVG